MSTPDPVTLTGIDLRKLLDEPGDMDLIDPMARAIYERLVAVQDQAVPPSLTRSSWEQMSTDQRRPYHDAAQAALRPVLLWALRQVMGRVRSPGPASA